MKTSKIKSTFFILFVSLAFVSCNSGNRKATDSENRDTEGRISTYEINISGGELDGKTFSGSFPNNFDSGGGGYLDHEFSYSSKNEATLGVSVTTDQNKGIVLKGNFILDNNGQALPIGDGLNHRDEKSTLMITIAEVDSFDPETTYSLVSKEGSLSISDLKVGPNIGGSVYSDYKAEFNGTFRDVSRPNDNINITGEFNIKSIRKE